MDRVFGVPFPARLVQLLLGPFRVTGGRVQVFVPEELGECDGLLSVSTRNWCGTVCRTQVRTNVKSTDDSVLVAQVASPRSVESGPINLRSAVVAAPEATRVQSAAAIQISAPNDAMDSPSCGISASAMRPMRFAAA